MDLPALNFVHELRKIKMQFHLQFPCKELSYFDISSSTQREAFFAAKIYLEIAEIENSFVYFNGKSKISPAESWE